MLLSLAWTSLVGSGLYLWFRSSYEYGKNTQQWTHSMMMSCVACLFLVLAAFVNKHFE